MGKIVSEDDATKEKEKPMVDDEAAKEAKGTEAGPLFVRILLSGPYSAGIAFVGGAILYEAVRYGLLWLVYVGVCFLVPFDLFLSCVVVQIAAIILWRVLSWRNNKHGLEGTIEAGEL